MSPSESAAHPNLAKRDVSEDAASPAGSSDGKKRRVTGNSSRGVANLTPDQLAKKRANDREAQRAIRERTKNQIETLERRIQELTSQQPYQELQHVIRQKEAVEAENAEIKKRLASVLAVIQPIVGHQGTEGSQYGVTSHPPVLGNPLVSCANRNAAVPNSMDSPGAAPPSQSTHWQAPQAPIGADIRGYPPSAAQQIVTQQRHDMTHALDMGPERLALDFLLDGSQRINRIPNGMEGNPTEPNFHNQPHKTGRESPGHHRSDTGSSASPHGHYNIALHAATKAAFEAPIQNGPPTCPLDNILLDFLQERQQQAADGVATPKLVGPAYPSVSSLLNPSRSALSHPLSKVFTDILGTFPDLSTLPEKIAVLYIMFLIMRWQISPTQENYDRLPDWVTPRASQLFTPHPAWIDHLPFPHMRDRLIRDYNPRDYLFDNFFIPFTTTLSLNWPYEPTDALLSSPETDELMINPIFERHLRKLENWTLGPAFARAMPGLVGTYRLKTDGDRR
ncbi:BZIP transcription factor [Phlyctema vagabunda]|uniref:BZIP transcription factor n=1 Tax=Phlyctema vagabunda TaxID=108571 RepID=A0ABR4PW83_9HELO